ncbi:MAG: hypothetical protein JSR41_10030 [Proteobacteria bacterium]|nr:hypothetical protein [Pseudomonadota bacterium]
MTIQLPIGLDVDGYTLRLSTNQRSFASPFGGSEQVIDLLQDRWLLTLSLAPRRHGDAGRIEGFINSMRGMTEVVYLYHFGRQQPIGTMRGAPTAQAASVGAGLLVVNTVAGATIESGDMLGCGGLLLQARAGAVADGSGVLQVPLANRLRKAIAGGAAVTWDRPAAPFRLISRVGVQFVPGYASGVSLDFAEAVDL